MELVVLLRTLYAKCIHKPTDALLKLRAYIALKQGNIERNIASVFDHLVSTPSGLIRKGNLKDATRMIAFISFTYVVARPVFSFLVSFQYFCILSGCSR